jgi:nitroreductase
VRVDRPCLAIGLAATLGGEQGECDEQECGGDPRRAWDSAMNGGWDVEPLGAKWATCLQSAIAAPSVHNTQPWRFRLGPHHVDVLVDPSRRLAAIDSMGREAMISVGAAVLNLRVAVLAAGRIPLTQLLPNPDEPDLVARITLGAPHQPDATVLALASAIGKRRTNRRPFREIDVRDEVLDQLITAARVEAVTLTVADLIDREIILDVVRTALDAQANDPRYVNELGSWTARDPMFAEGVPAQSFGPTHEWADVPVRDFGLTHPDVRRRHAWFETAPTVVMLSTETETPVQWLRAGQAMERVLLTATVRGVANTPMTAPTEVPQLRALLHESGDRRVAQVILRLGYGDPCPPTPRRPLADVLEITRAPVM